MYWLLKMHKTPIGAIFIVASKNFSTKPLSDVISKVFKVIFNHDERFHTKSLFHTYFKKVWFVKNSFSIPIKLNKIYILKKSQNFQLYHIICDNSSQPLN